MRVFIILRGHYSGRYIAGVVETEEEAKRICDAINCSSVSYHNDAYYEEHDTKQFITKKLQWVVEWAYPGWDVRCADTYEHDDITESTEYYDGYYVVFADNKDQAIKIAQDIRAEKMAEREGVKV